MMSVWRFVLAVGMALAVPVSVSAQGFRIEGAAQVSSVSVKRTAAATTSVNGFGIGGVLRMSVWLALLEVRYEQASLSESGGASPEDMVEGEVLVGIRFLPWLTVKAGPRIRANVTELGTERWVLWEGRIRADVRLIGTTVRGHAEAWSILSGEVNLTDPFNRGQGVEGGLEFKLFGDFWGGLGYRFDHEVLAGDVREDITEKVYLRFGVGGF